jgi:hypothetical protein
MADAGRTRGVAANCAAAMTAIVLGLWTHTRDSTFLSNMRVAVEIGGYTIGTIDLLVAVALAAGLQRAIPSCPQRLREPVSSLCT